MTTPVAPVWTDEDQRQLDALAAKKRAAQPLTTANHPTDGYRFHDCDRYHIPKEPLQ